MGWSFALPRLRGEHVQPFVVLRVVLKKFVHTVSIQPRNGFCLEICALKSRVYVPFSLAGLANSTIYLPGAATLIADVVCWFRGVVGWTFPVFGHLPLTLLKNFFYDVAQCGSRKIQKKR